MAMFKYLLGASPPPKKSKISDVEYEEKRKRNFQECWKNEYPWLYQDESGKMLCKVCVDSRRNPKSSFVLGSDSFGHDSVRKHQETEQHAKLAKEKKSRLMPIEKTASG